MAGDDGAHDVTILPWAGVAYLARLNGELGTLDVCDDAFRYTAIAVGSISAKTKTSCHDVGLDPVRRLAFCPANEDETYLLDVSDPLGPRYVGSIVNATLGRDPSEKPKDVALRPRSRLLTALAASGGVDDRREPGHGLPWRHPSTVAVQGSSASPSSG